jgi:hypothetical protein
LTFAGGNTTPELHDVWDAGDTLIQRYPAPVFHPECAALPRSSGYTRDSKYGFALWARGSDTMVFLNVVSHHEGVFAIAPPSEGWAPQQALTTAFWSPVADKLYFDQLGGIWTWTPAGGASQLVPRLSWAHPAMSPDGKYIAYVSGPSNNPTVHLMNPETGADQGQIGAGQRVMPKFLNKDLIWMKFAVGDGSPANTACSQPRPQSYIYDLRNRTEYSSILDWVSATWPATSAVAA